MYTHTRARDKIKYPPVENCYRRFSFFLVWFYNLNFNLSSFGLWFVDPFEHNLNDTHTEGAGAPLNRAQAFLDTVYVYMYVYELSM